MRGLLLDQDSSCCLTTLGLSASRIESHESTAVLLGLSRNPTDARQVSMRDKSADACLMDSSSTPVSYPMGYEPCELSNSRTLVRWDAFRERKCEMNRCRAMAEAGHP